MSRPRFFEVSIPQPCSEDWARMTPDEKGRFCGSCQKVVLDFTTMSDAELVAALRSAGAGCGRFRVDQLDRPLYLPAVAARPSGWDWRKAVAAVMVAGGLAKPASAQVQSGAPGTEQTAPQQGEAEVVGVVTDENKEPVINATVVVKQGDLIKGNAVSDLDGYFRIRSLAAGTYTLRVTLDGYTTRELTDIRLDAGPVTVNVPLARTGKGALDSSTRFVPPLVTAHTVAGGLLIAEDIERLPTRNAAEAASLNPTGVWQQGGDSGLTIMGGAPPRNNLVFIDGIQRTPPKKKSFFRRLLFWKD